MRHKLSGFTLIELLIVVVIIGVLAGVAIPKFAATKGQAYVSQMKSDLRNFATAQEVYQADNGTYYNGPVPAAGLVYSPSTGITISVQNVSQSGWGAVASSPLAPRTCAIFFGTGGPVAPATVGGQITCTP